MPREDDELEITLLRRQLEDSLVSNGSLAKENDELRQEVTRLKAQISSLRAHNHERKSMLWKKLHNSMDGNNNIDVSQQKPSFLVSLSGQQSPAMEKRHQKQDFPESEFTKGKPAKVPNPQPSPVSLTSPPLFKEVVKDNKVSSATIGGPPPPPPPLPSKSLVGSKAVRRVPEVMELYRSLTRRDANIENKSSAAKVPAFALTRNMIGEIENRSTYISAVKSEVEKQAEFINLLIREVESAAHKRISDVEAFVTWLDEQLSSLVDERAVLKHFPQWPERKADTMREAACNYRDLRNLKIEVQSFEDNPKEPLSQALRKMQELQDRLERSINNVERTRESTSKRYKDLKIPWDWMLDTGLIGEMKLSSLRLAKEYMKRITKELQCNECTREENLLLQGVRFAYRIHQFAGGFDGETIYAFQELKRVGLV
ncbi:INCREASED PETAL GROWTH ANISOTROPY 1-like protein 1 [Cannabis sativa]|uniref:INCREASED PETAL GROWTH ANISOTROPY 1-like protein 1 n=1 Tax=Cannabis sativa TaxID=3483 RepID=UPI0029CA2047|nr:INCREASED PETAL GROWTH ANISOTROPY 1-like protein 1 [Cannabis sativa]XP_060966636.1 INCREASED PETAL GROWTH ANISOTROPY 1-like protein 1 [Cannabis sativa]